MADIEITDEASLEAWLKTRPRRDAFVVRSRATIRNLRPSTFSLLGEGVEKNLSLLVYLRFLQVTGLILTNPDALLGQAHFSATKDFSTLKLTQLADIEVERIPDPEDDDQEIRELDEISPDRLAKFIGKQNQLHVASQKLNLVLSVRDCRSLETGQTVAPLWHDTPAPDWFTQADRETRAIWAKDPPTWAFWEKWWDGVISGDMPFPPELLRDVALIEDDIWQAGPKAVAERINLLIQRHALQREAAAIHARLMEFIAINEGLGANLHNQPPEDELSPVKLRATLGEISQALKEIEVALDGPEILPEVVVGLGQRLKDLWDGLMTMMRSATKHLLIGALAGVGGAMAIDAYDYLKPEIDVPSFFRRLQDFGKELEKAPSPAPVFPPRPPVDL